MAINDIAGITFIVLGSLVSFIAGIWYLVVMFRESIWWGFGQIFCGAGIIFLFVHWEDAWRPGLTILAANAVVLFGFFLSPSTFQTLDALDNGGTYSDEETPYWYQEENLRMEVQPGEEPLQYMQDEQQDTDAQATATAPPSAEERRRQQEEALRKRQERYGTFTLTGVLEVDPATLTTPEQIQRYAQGLKFKKADLVERRRLLDRENAAEVADLKKDISLLKKRTAEFKQAVADFKAHGAPQIDPTAPAELEDEDFDPGSFY